MVVYFHNFIIQISSHMFTAEVIGLPKLRCTDTPLALSLTHTHTHTHTHSLYETTDEPHSQCLAHQPCGRNTLIYFFTFTIYHFFL